MTAVAVPPIVPIRQRPTPAPVEPDELLKMADNGLFELVDGKLMEKGMGFLSGDVAVQLILRLGGFVQAQKLGKLVSEVSFQCFPNKPLQTRRPDIAFLSAARLAGVPAEGHVPVRPDLAIEVTPNDNAIDLDSKLIDYQSAGIPLVWVFNPTAGTARVYRPDGSSRHLGQAGTLDGEEVVPGFKALLADLLPAAAAA